MHDVGRAAAQIVFVVGDHPVVAATWALVVFPLAFFIGLGAFAYTAYRRSKRCPECRENVRDNALRCRFCGHRFETGP